MKIAVIGAGAIGNVAAGYLTLNNETVYLIGRPRTVKMIKKNGLLISGARGETRVNLEVSERLREKPDVAILAVKTQDVEEALKDNLAFLKETCLLTTQNGVRADSLVAHHLPVENTISSIVMFGATSLEEGKVIHNFDGDWIIGKMFGPNDSSVNALQALLNNIFPTIITDDIRGMKYLKIFVNANNCIPAILGMSMQEAFADPSVSRISIGIWKEGLGIVTKSNVTLTSLPDFPLERLGGLTAMPIDEAAKIFSGIMINLSKEPLYGSILQSIKRGRASEIDFINGEFITLAKENALESPLNQKLVEMVHEVERANTFFSKEKLLAETEKLIP
ncbi:MAG: 2-dehydropantoate 2-reductase [Thermodesulfobacteriota bacterium]|jgi:2-dehydropantoate 2-reductase|nr:MAG: 2-dehydropantoate 2-reductase [Thermodesulfobacteriota bacterium]